jgi:DNA-binding SARP family transcriptional activator
MIRLSQETVFQQLQELGEDIRLVIVHPGYVQQHSLLNLLLDQTGMVYVRFDGAKLANAELNTQLETEITHQTETLQSVKTLVLDECDRADVKAFDTFLPRLLSQMAIGRVVILSREVPQCVLANDSLRSQTRFVPTDDGLMLSEYTQQGDDAMLLEVRALGSGRILLNGKSVDNWDGVLPRSLFFYLVDRGMTTRSEIFDTFWPSLSTREATNVFHVTKRKISEVLGMDLTVYWSGFYRISPDIKLSYDAALFSEMIQDSAVATPEDSERLLERAISLYHCDFLTSVDMDWVMKRRRELLEGYGEALISLAKMVEKSGEFARALGLYVRAAMTNPQREDLARSIMLLYQELGQYEDAIATYDRLESELERSLGVSPAPQLQELRASIRSEKRKQLVQ